MIKASSINKSFGDLHVLKEVDLYVASNEIVTITGASGAGKTTLLQILGTLDNPDSGKVEIDSVDVSSLKSNKLSEFRNSTIGFVFQFHQLLPEFTALENVMMPALIGSKSFDFAKSEAIQIIDYLGLKQRINHKPSELSGGEKQRIAVARALINRPKIVFADEPSGSLDSKNKDELHQLLFKIRADFSTTLLIVTHDTALSSISDRSLEMMDGKFI